MLNIDGFSQPSIDFVNELLYAEGQINPYEGKCNQKQLREQAQKPRTPAQQEADRQRAQAARGRQNVSTSSRSEAAKKAAETRRRCKGGGSSTGPAT
jgi:hypothetical protein